MAFLEKRIQAVLKIGLRCKVASALEGLRKVTRPDSCHSITYMFDLLICWSNIAPKHKNAKIFDKCLNPVMLVFIG